MGMTSRRTRRLNFFRFSADFGQVHFVGDDEVGPLAQFLLVKADFLAQLGEVVARIAAFAARHVDDEEQHAAALDVAQEFVAEADALVRALDQAGNIGHGDAGEIGIFDHADHRLQRGERIGRDLRVRVGKAREQRRFARVRIADQPGVGDRFQLELELAALALLAVLVAARRLVGRRLEIHVAAPAATAGAEDKFVARLDQVGHRLEHRRIFRHAGEIVRRAAAFAVFVGLDGMTSSGMRLTTVPGGTVMMQSAPDLPDICFLPPFCPFLANWCGE